MQVGYAYASRFQHVKLLHIVSSESERFPLSILCSGARAISKPDSDHQHRVTCDKCKASVSRRRGAVVAVAS